MNLDDIGMHLEIRQALARYSHGVDHGDLELARSAYWPEATDQHGGIWNGNGIEFVTQLIARNVESRANGFPAVGPLHHLTTTLVQRTGDDQAKVQTYFIVCGNHGTDGVAHFGLVVGRYLDRFERRGDEWRIIARVVINDFTRHDVPGDIWPLASWQAGGFPGGGYGRSDPGVRFFAS
jgi:SnoaL-like domain